MKTPRITNPYILSDELVEETGIAALDDFLYGLINILQISHREHLRAILLIGSYVHGILHYPLTLPDPDQPDYEFLWSLQLCFKRVQELACALVFLTTGEFIFPINAIMSTFERTIESPCTDLLLTVQQAAYTETTDEERNSHHTKIRHQLTAFENWVLLWLRENGIKLPAEVCFDG